MAEPTTTVSALRWRDGLELLDQRLLPRDERWIRVDGAAAAIRAIRTLAVRGAPAIGLAGAYALAAEARRNPDRSHLRRAARRLAAARPTGADLAQAVARVLVAIETAAPGERFERALAAAEALHASDAAACLAMAAHGAALFPGENVALLTHCNAGALATGGIGSALGVVRAVHAEGRLERLYACEARPVLQGARLTAWEAARDGIPVTLLPDSAAASLLGSGAVAGVVLGADRVAADGSIANKVGTYSLALAAARHGVPFVSVAPTTTFDPTCATGVEIRIEQRSPSEVVTVGRRLVAPPGVAVYNPAFDVTPPELITAIVSERGVARPVNPATVREIGP
ncbi:MAG TPA: S-methyl-5-thioribose-1-phosphate isomerase [Thermoanaerobaculaceae bacterium]|nr:S-methyl-5-thioribose-1-phosphate isomerase [Thermoanaerobaculaceae bacterium]